MFTSCMASIYMTNYVNGLQTALVVPPSSDHEFIKKPEGRKSGYYHQYNYINLTLNRQNPTQHATYIK